MLKGFTIWNKQTVVSKKLVLLFLFISEIPLSISFFHERYVSFLDANSWMTEAWQLLLFGLCVLSFAGMLIRLAEKEMEEFSLIAYWTSLSGADCDTYIICSLIPWMELGLGFALTFGNFTYVHPVAIIMGVFGVDVLCIRIGVRYARAKSVRGKSQKLFGAGKEYVPKSPKLRLMRTALKHRLRCWDVTAMTLFLNIIYISLCGMVSGKALFVMSVIFVIFLYVLEDRIFESEGISFAYYRSIGISLNKYLCVQVLSSIVYSQLPVFIFFTIYSHNLLQVGLFTLLMIGFSVYWNVVFIYNENRNQQNRMIKFWYEIISLWISVLPVINVVWIFTKYKKLKKEWNND